ncbi:MAG: chromate transporter [Patescibacteria group bacterium]
MDSLKNLLDDYLGKKAPALPMGVKDFLVKIAPWAVILSLIIMIPGVLAYWRLGTLMMPYAYYVGGRSALFTLSTILSAIAIIINILAIPGLFKRTASGWNFIFYGVLVSTVSSLVSGNIVGAIIGFLISMYLIFQIRSYYN